MTINIVSANGKELNTPEERFKHCLSSISNALNRIKKDKEHIADVEFIAEVLDYMQKQVEQMKGAGNAGKI